MGGSKITGHIVCIGNFRHQPDCVRTVPGNVIAITPPHEQLHVEPAVSAGFPPIIVRLAPGFHGVVTGMHGIGVNTPKAALVAAATVGLDKLEHIPNGAMLTMGAKSVTVAAGLPSTITRGVGSGLSVEGARPKLHCNIAPSAAF
jgi:hypothetical protein